MKNWLKAIGVTMLFVGIACVTVFVFNTYPVILGQLLLGGALGFSVYTIKKQFDFDDSIDEYLEKRRENSNQ